MQRCCNLFLLATISPRPLLARARRRGIGSGSGTCAIVRPRFPRRRRQRRQHRFRGKKQTQFEEIQAFLAFCVLAIVKVVKEETWESFIADTLLFAKVFLIAVSLILDYHLTIYYMIGFLVIYISTQQPAFEGLGNAHHMTPLQLETLLTEGNTSRFWLVEFRASCSLASVRTSRVLPDLSNMYSNKNMSFGIVDIGHFPNAAEKFGISLGVNMAPLPTYILFKNATEVARLPKVDFEAKSSSPTITKSLLCRYFELDLHLLEYVSGK